MRFLLDEQVWVAVLLRKSLWFETTVTWPSLTPSGTGHLSWYVAKKQSDVIQISR